MCIEIESRGGDHRGKEAGDISGEDLLCGMFVGGAVGVAVESASLDGTPE